MAPAAIADASISPFISLPNGLAAVVIQLSHGKTLALPSAHHRVTSRGLELLAGADISIDPSDGLVIVGVPVGPDCFVVDYMRKLPTELGMPTVASHVAVMEDAQTVALILSMSLAP